MATEVKWVDSVMPQRIIRWETQRNGIKIATAYLEYNDEGEYIAGAMFTIGPEARFSRGKVSIPPTMDRYKALELVRTLTKLCDRMGV